MRVIETTGDTYRTPTPGAERMCVRGVDPPRRRVTINIENIHFTVASK